MTKTLFIEFETSVIDSGKKGTPAPIRLQPHILKYLGKISEELNFSVVLFKAPSSSSSTYRQVLALFEGEGIKITDDKREHDLRNSYFVGGPLAKKEATQTGTEYIMYAKKNTGNWSGIYNYLSGNNRLVKHSRTTRETQIEVEINLDGSGKAKISTGLNFLDHMLEQIARHGGFDLKIKAKGDLHIDEHHTMEDTAITLGEAFLIALGDKRGIERYGFCLPMDDALAQVAVDFGGRNYLVWQAAFKREKVGDVPTELFSHFFKSFSDAAKCNLNIKVEGENEHHKIEAIFKAFAKALKMAAKKDLNNLQLPSTKGLL